MSNFSISAGRSQETEPWPDLTFCLSLDIFPVNIRVRRNKMKSKIGICFGVFLLLFFFVLISSGQNQESIYRLGLELDKQASYLAQSSYEHFKGRRGTISDQEQAVLFKSEAFAASCRLFLKLTGGSSNYYQSGYLRTNLHSAFMYLARSFKELEEEMQRSGVRPYALSDCRRTLDRMDDEFSRWPAPDNLAYLHQKYIKARDATVYMVERRGPGLYVKHAFKNLESIFRYNYSLNRGRDPWQFLVEVAYETLDKMEEGPMIDMTFEGYLVIENTNRPNRPVYLIERGKKRGITSPQVLQRFGGWKNVYEVPVEVISKYPEGEPVR